MTEGLLVLVQLVMAAINTLPWRISPSMDGAETTTVFGVGRLLAISSSVVGLVLRSAAALGETGSWLPPPGARPSASWPFACTKKVLLNSALDLPKPFSVIGLENE